METIRLIQDRAKERLSALLIHLPCFSFCPRKARRRGQSAGLHGATEYTGPEISLLKHFHHHCQHND